MLSSSQPQLLVILRPAPAAGYFTPQRFHGCLSNRTDEQLLSARPRNDPGLAADPSHSVPARSSRPELAAKMKEIGLQPSSTGEPSGKETGQHISQHRRRRPYAKAYARLAASGFQLHWQSAPAGEQAKMERESKTKLSCPECRQNETPTPSCSEASVWPNISNCK